MFLIILIAGIKHVEMTQHMCGGLRVSFLRLGEVGIQGEEGIQDEWTCRLFPPFLASPLPSSCLSYASDFFLHSFTFSSIGPPSTFPPPHLHHRPIQGTEHLQHTHRHLESQTTHASGPLSYQCITFPCCRPEAWAGVAHGCWEAQGFSKGSKQREQRLSNGGPEASLSFYKVSPWSNINIWPLPISQPKNK